MQAHSGQQVSPDNVVPADSEVADLHAATFRTENTTPRGEVYRGSGVCPRGSTEGRPRFLRRRAWVGLTDEDVDGAGAWDRAVVLVTVEPRGAAVFEARAHGHHLAV